MEEVGVSWGNYSCCEWVLILIGVCEVYYSGLDSGKSSGNDYTFFFLQHMMKMMSKSRTRQINMPSKRSGSMDFYSLGLMLF